MNTLVLSKSRKGNLPFDIPASEEVKHAISQPTKPVKRHITASIPMVEPQTTKLAYMNHLRSADFLLSPLETILESIYDPGLDNVSLHDLIEAYNTISTRIRSRARILLQDQPPPAIESLREHSSSLTYALKRDLRRALVEPATHSQESLFTDIPISSHDIQYARDMAALCLHVLRFLSDVFVFKALYSVFSKHELHELFDALLKLALVDNLTTPSRQKTWAFVVWIIQVQNLPSATLEHKRTDVVTVLRRSIEGELGPQSRLDGLKAIPHILKHHPKLFITSFVDILPSILDCLISDSVDCRTNAALALGSFGLTKLGALTSSDYSHDKIVDAIHSFIRFQTSRNDSSQDEPSLLIITKDSLLGSNEPTWALTVLAAIIVLLDYSLFLHPRSIKFCLNHLAYVASHEYSDVAALHPHIWRILVWAFSRIPHKINVGQNHMQQNKSKKDPRFGAFKVVAQVLKGGVGIALTSALLGASEDVINPSVASDNVSKALSVVEEMVAGKSGSDPEDGLLLLNRLVSAIGTASHSTVPAEEWEKNHFPSTRLLDGSVLHSNVKKLGRVVRKMEVVKMDHVRQLSEAEIVGHWDALAAIWASSVRGAFEKPRFRFWDELLHIWQSLLLAQADLAKENGHLTASSAFAKRVASIVTHFLPVDLSGATVYHLTLLKKLWNVLKNIFSSSWLHSPAEIILAAVLMCQFSFEDDSVKSAWSELCADLISAGIPSVLHVVSSRSELGQGLEVTRQLWTVLAKAWQSPNEGIPWGNVAAFLAIPYRWGSPVTKTAVNVDVVDSVWELSEMEFELWDGVLRSAMTLAGAASVRPVEVVTNVLRRIGEDRVGLLPTSLKPIISLLSHVDISVGNTLPVEIFSSVNLALVSHYPISKQELQPLLVEILHSLGEIISAAPIPMLLQLLTAIEQGLYLWIRDESEVLTQTQHDTLVMAVYCRALNILRHQQPALKTLLAISSFLTSGFGRLHEPLIGPLAFEDFWRATYHHIDEFKPHYTESLRNCLLAFSDTWGGSMGDGLSNYSESQKTKMSTVPDSQPSRYETQGSWRYVVNPAVSHPGSSPITQGMRTSPSRHVPETPLPDTERVAKRPKFDRPDHLAALNQLQQYFSYRDDESSTRNTDLPAHSSCHTSPSTTRPPSLPDPEHTPLNLSMPLLPSLDAPDQSDDRKRPTDVDDQRSLKRRKIDPERKTASVTPGVTRTQSDGLRRVKHSLHNRPIHKNTQSEAFSPTFPASHLHDDASQTTEYRKRKMVLDWVGPPGCRESYPSRLDGAQPSAPKLAQSYHVGHRGTMSPGPSSPEDYNSWEASISEEEMRRLQRELGGSDFSIPETEMDVADDPDGDRTDALTDPLDQNILSSPSLGHLRQLHQTRSQTAPGSIPVRSPSRPTPLRRHQTTSTGLNIDGLLQTCAAVEDNASQAPVADLMHATALINKIGTKLTEHLTRRLIGCETKPS